MSSPNDKSGVEVPQPTIVKSILKNSQKDGGSKGIQWDEANLTYNEANKSAKMKIDEPPTPYEYDSDEEHRLEAETDANTKLNAALKEIEDDPAERKTASFAPSEEEQEKESEFKKKRKQHYNEFQKVKELKEKGEL